MHEHAVLVRQSMIPGTVEHPTINANLNAQCTCTRAGIVGSAMRLIRAICAVGMYKVMGRVNGPEKNYYLINTPPLQCAELPWVNNSKKMYKRN